MKIENDRVIYIAFTLKDESGNLLDEAPQDEPLPFIYGRGQLIPGLESALKDKQVGESFEVTLTPEEAFGTHEEELLQVATKDMFEDIDPIEIGMDIEVEMTTDEGEMMTLGRVVKVEGDDVLIDLNHPLAGRVLNYNVNVIDIREMTAEEQDLGIIKELMD